MRHRTNLWTAFIALCGLSWGAICVFADRVLADETPQQFLVLTDLHFDPFINCPDAATIDRLASASVAEWPALLEAYQSRGTIRFGSDAPWPLIRDALADASAQGHHLKMVLSAGDFLTHEWQTKYQNLTKRDPKSDPIYFRFTSKTIAFLASQIERTFPGIPFFPVLGNNDSYCGDYQIVPAGSFAAVFADTFAPLTRGTAEQTANFQTTVRRGGYYSLPLPGKRRIISLNSVFFSGSYQKCTPNVNMPAAAFEQLQFLDRELTEAARAGERVWLLMHIPPGIDGYATGNDPSGGIDPLWQDTLPVDFTDRFLSLLGPHQKTLEMAFAGHSHMCDFRLIRETAAGPGTTDGSEAPPLILKIVPGVSPLFSNNPAYEIFQRTEKGEFHFKTRYLALTTDNALPPVNWSTAEDVLGLSPLNAEKISQVAQAILAQPATTGSTYLRQYYVNSLATPAADSKFLDDIACAMWRVRVSNYRKCRTE